jgi:putative CocE/NonD family hydrolase
MKAIAGWLLVPSLLVAQGLEFVKANYTKYEFEIPMRDGVKLYTAVYAPKDQSQKYPILMQRTPYSIPPYGADNYRANLGPSEKLARDLYIFVYQDVRGRWMSEGEFVQVRPHVPAKRGSKDIDESSDTYDTIDWLVKNVPNHNGRAGLWGISYPGFYAAMGAIDAHPALKASSPQAPVCDWFIGDDWHHNGAFFLQHAFRWMSGNDRPRPAPTRKRGEPFDYGTPDGYKFYLTGGPVADINEKHLKNELAFWNEMMRRPNYDEFWKARDMRPHLKNMKPAMMTVGGWYDAENLFGALKTYESSEKQSPGAFNILVMGPWYHGQWAADSGERLGFVAFNSKTSEYYREHIEFPFFQHFLKQKGDMKLSEAHVFETGSNQWRAYDAWPPKAARERTLYFRAGGKLSFEPPPESAGFDEYLSDPSRPVPVINSTAIGMTREYMVEDQRFAATRPDVLVYETEPLKEDLIIAGPITASLHVSTSGTDSDFIVKLIDVYPDDFPDPQPNPANVRMGAFQQLVRGEPFRGRFRESFEKPVPFPPNEPVKIEYVLPDSYHNFRRGHRIMIQVQSTWFPLVDRNPQKFVENIFHAKASDFTRATQRVYRARNLASLVKVMALER